MANENDKNQKNNEPTPVDVSAANVNTTPMASESTVVAPNADTEDTKAKAGEYVVLDIVLYRLEGEEGKRKTKKYRRGQTVNLTAPQAKTLLAEPRPSVRVKDKDGK